MTIPDLDLDLFTQASLCDPFADYDVLRNAGPVVKLRRPDVYAMGRFEDVQAALRAPDILLSGEGVGFSDAFNASKGHNVLQTDGDVHRRLRMAVMRPLTPANLRAARADLKAMVVARVDALKGVGEFDAMRALAAFLPVEAISHLVGLPEAGREQMLEWAAATFNVIGPDPLPQDMAVVAQVRAFIGSLDESQLRDGSWAAQLFVAADKGQVSRADALAAISAYIIPSLDTTILAKGHLLNLLATNPDQWAALRAQPQLIPQAVLESVRHSAVIRWFSRVAADDYPIGDQVIPQGQRVMLLYGSANRDERRYQAPHEFDISREARDQLAWGSGVHMCAGMHLARLEMEVMLEALVEVGSSLAAGPPQVGVNQGLFGFEALPFRID